MLVHIGHVRCIDNRPHATLTASLASVAESSCPKTLQGVWEDVQRRDPHEVEFQQAVKEVLDTMSPVFDKHPEYVDIMKRVVEPERVIMFRVRISTLA